MGAGDIAGGLGGAIGGLVAMGTMGPNSTSTAKQALAVVEALKQQNYDFTKLSGQDLAVLQKFYPQMYNAVVPDDVKLALDSQQGRSGEVQALSGMQDIAQQGMGTADRLSAKIAGDEMGGQLQRNQNNITSDLAQRGRLGGGEEIAARMAGNAASSDYAAKYADKLAQASMARRMEALTGSSAMANRLRSGDINLSGRNADAINNFNMQRSQIQNAANLQNTQAANQAGMYNVQTGQNVANANVGRRNAENWQNKEREDSLKKNIDQFNMQKTGMLQGAWNNLGGAYDADNALKAQIGTGIGQGVGQAAGGAFGFF
jgi:hypothetical protein